MVPSMTSAPAVWTYVGVPMGAPPAKVAVIPRLRACLAISPLSTSSAPKNSTLGLVPRTSVSTEVKSFWSGVTTLSTVGVTPSFVSSARNESCSPLP